VSRPTLEGAVRTRVRALPNVAFLDRCDVERPTFEAGRVTGVVVRRRGSDAEETIAADLVVDATGRGSQSPKWLEQWGYGRPQTTSLKVDVGYATRILERKPGDFHDSVGGIVASTVPHGTRFRAVTASEGQRW